MGLRSRTAFAGALALLLSGIVLPASYARWLDTRTFVALELPVSLGAGKVSSRDFKVNLAGWYQIGVDVDREFPFRFNCGFGARPPLLRTTITIYQNGRIVEHFDGADRFLGHFHGDPGKIYRFDLDILTDASCLNAGHPKIFVWTQSDSYERLKDLVLAASAVFFLAGLGTLSFSVGGATFDRALPRDIVDVSNAIRGDDAPKSARRLTPRFARIPHFGLLFSMILSVVLLPASFFYDWEFGYPSGGITVHLIRVGPLRSSEYHPAALILHVECLKYGTPTRLHLNSRSIEPALLPDALKSEFKTRADWVVYIAGDTYCTWEDVANAIDIVRTAGGRVVLLTATPSTFDSVSARR